MGSFGKSLWVVGGIAYLLTTAQGFSHSNETPIKAGVPAMANVVLSTGTSGDAVVVQVQVPPGQVFPVNSVKPFLIQIGQATYPVHVV